MTMLGIGAKTAAGYGYFTSQGARPANATGRDTAEFQLTLVTPAFLAGAGQGESDCDLRGATLRGQLRWWWRTMHAGHLDTATLRRLEAAIWGASSEGSAVAIRLAAKDASQPEPFRVDQSLVRKNQLRPADRGRIQGVSYVSYGMSEKPRYYRQPGDCWSVDLIARSTELRLDPMAKRGTGIPIDASVVLAEATASLWLLSRYGGVGAKGRKGYGSFIDLMLQGIEGVTEIQRQAAGFREHCHLPTKLESKPTIATLERMRTEQLPLGSLNEWLAIDALGRSYQDVLKTLDPAVKGAKELLGTPRKNLRSRHARLASTLHLHVTASSQELSARITTFDLPGINPQSEALLAAVRTGMKQGLARLRPEGAASGALYPPRKPVILPEASDKTSLSERPYAGLGARQPIGAGGKPPVGGKVQAVLLEERTKKGGWRARDQVSGEVRSIMNSHVIPEGKSAGDVVPLDVPNNSEFKWPVAPPPAPPRQTKPQRRR
jgi:CRISPR-associated protein Cmr6